MATPAPHCSADGSQSRFEFTQPVRAALDVEGHGCGAAADPGSRWPGPRRRGGSPASKILSDESAPEGFRAFAGNGGEQVNALNVSAAEWEVLASVKLPRDVVKDGYVQILITIRAISQ